VGSVHGQAPPVAVRDIAIHPRESDVLLATHGRGIYVLDDITPLRALTPAVLESDVALLDSRPSEARFGAQIQDFPGDDEFVGANRPDVAYITYYLKERHVKGDFVVQVLDPQGKLLTTLPAGKRRGINRVEWPMRLKAPKVPAGAQVEFGSLFGPVAAEGAYTVKLVKDGQEYVGKLTLVGDPTLPHSAKDRALQQQTVMKVYDMLERLAYIAEASRDLRDQVENRFDGAKGDAELVKELGAFSARLDAFYATLAATREGRITGEEQLREKLGDLYGGVSGYAGRPTPSQLDRLATLNGEVDRSARTFDGFVTADVKRLNDRLAAKGLKPLAPVSREEFDRRTAR
jgi:hypothetical protein